MLVALFLTICSNLYRFFALFSIGSEHEKLDFAVSLSCFDKSVDDLFKLFNITGLWIFFL